jgi:hypothetical protein
MLTAEMGIPVFLINSSTGGQPISYWMDGSQGWADVKSAVAAAGGDFEFGFWYQGESDAHTASALYMQNKWDTLRNQCQALTGRGSTTLRLGMVSLGPGSYGGSTEGQFGAMRVNQATYSSTAPGWFYAGGIHDGVTPGDYVHIDGDSHGRLGRREARSLLALYGKGVSGAGPRIVSVSLSGSKVVFTVQHAGGSALKDGIGGTGTALTGFTIRGKNSGTVLAYTATAITGANTFKLTLTAAPTEPITAEYAITDVPHGAYASGKTTFIPASCLYDNVVMPNAPTGCPLQPCAALTVTGS